MIGNGGMHLCQNERLVRANGHVGQHHGADPIAAICVSDFLSDVGKLCRLVFGGIVDGTIDGQRAAARVEDHVDRNFLTADTDEAGIVAVHKDIGNGHLNSDRGELPAESGGGAADVVGRA